MLLSQPSWVFFALISVSFLALAEITQQFIVNNKKPFSPQVSGGLTFLVEAIFGAVLWFVFRDSISFEWQSATALWPYILFMSILGSISMPLYLKSFQVKNISLSATILSLSVLVSTVIGILAFGEGVSAIKFLGILFILGAIVLVNFKNPLFEKNHLFAFFAAGLFGISYSMDKFIMGGIHPLPYITFVFGGIALFSFIFYRKLFLAELWPIRKQAVQGVALSATGYFAYNLATFLAYTVGGEVGKIDAINNTQVIIIILFEYFVLKHAKGTLRKLVSAFLAVLGIYLLTKF